MCIHTHVYLSIIYLSIIYLSIYLSVYLLRLPFNLVFSVLLHMTHHFHLMHT
jgi:hypothetical protein